MIFGTSELETYNADGFGTMTFESIISVYRSLPSRVPTPATMDMPGYVLAMLLITYLMATRLPTPAPPNSPIFPPREYAAHP